MGKQSGFEVFEAAEKHRTALEAQELILDWVCKWHACNDAPDSEKPNRLVEHHHAYRRLWDYALSLRAAKEAARTAPEGGAA